jgi:hypothetical protein
MGRAILLLSLQGHETCTRVNVIFTYKRQEGPGLSRRYSVLIRAGLSRDRIPVGARFSAPDQTGPVAHPTSYAMGTGSLSQG